MQVRTNRFRSLTLSAAVALLLASGGAFAQDGPRRGPNDTLRGPSVNDRAMPREERFGDSMMQGRGQAGDMATYRFMVASISELSKQDNERLQLTPDQTEKLTDIQNAYQKALREYMSQAREQTKNLRERVQRAREEAGDDREALQQLMERVRARTAEIREAAPKSERAEAAMWEVLTQPQRRFVNNQIEERREEMTQQRRMQREGRGTDAQRPGADRGEGAQRPGRRGGDTDLGPDARPGGPMGPGGPEAGERRQRGPQAERPQNGDQGMRRWAQLSERIQRLTPEQQDRLYNMLIQTLERVEGASEARPGDRPQRPDARPGGRRGPGAEGGGPRPTDAQSDRPRRGPRPGADRD